MMAESLNIGGVAVSKIAESFGTPLYVHDGDFLSHRLRETRLTTKGVFHRLYYSLKANPLLAVANAAICAGFGLDACSLEDVEISLRAGASAGDISYTGVGLLPVQLKYLNEKGVHVNVDSIEEAVDWADVNSGCPVGLRILPSIEAGFHPDCYSGAKSSKFGMFPNQAIEAGTILGKSGCEVTTLHAHIGSSVLGVDPYIETLKVLLDLASAMPSVGRINLGGGWDTPYRMNSPVFPLRDLCRVAGEAVVRFNRSSGRDIKLEAEPGEYLVADSGYLIVRVLSFKEREVDGRKGRMVVVDGGMNLAPAHALYGTHFEVALDGGGGTNMYATDICGNTNHAADKLVSGRMLPSLTRGDILVISPTGAYAWARSTRFNERCRPGTAWVQGGKMQLVRNPETVDKLIHGEAIPTNPLSGDTLG